MKLLRDGGSKEGMWGVWWRILGGYLNWPLPAVLSVAQMGQDLMNTNLMPD